MGFINEMKVHKYRTLKTAVLCLTFISLGMLSSIPGPTMLDLQIAANTSLFEISKILPSRSGGYAIGAIISGIILDYFDHQVLLLLSIFISVGAFALTPFCRSIIIMCSVLFINGIATGGIDTCGNVWLIHLWGKENPPFMQILHFAYGLGAFIGPFIAEPFLLPVEEIEQLKSNLTNSNESNFEIGSVDFYISNKTFLDDFSEFRNETIKYTAEDLEIHWAYIIVSLINLAIFIFFIIVYCIKPDNKPHPTRVKETEKTTDEKSKDAIAGAIDLSSKYTSLPVSSKVKYSLVILSTMFMHVYCGLEISFGSLLATFAVKSNLQMSKSAGSFITSMYWGAFTFFRIFSLIAITYISPRFLLIFNLALIMLSNVFLLPYANTYVWALWVGAGLMGLGCSSVFATLFAFLEEMIPVTSRITSGFMVAACIGEFIIPYIVGYYIETKPEVYLYVIFVYSLLSAIIMSVMLIIQTCLIKKQNRKLKNLNS